MRFVTLSDAVFGSLSVVDNVLFTGVAKGKQTEQGISTSVKEKTCRPRHARNVIAFKYKSISNVQRPDLEKKHN